MNKNHRLLYKLSVTALFAALCYVGVNIRVPLPVGFVHLGNLICVIAALLCGGVVGGLSGSIGMGLFDIFYYGGFTAGVVRTILLKFALGFIAGMFFRFVLKRKWSTVVLNSIFLFLFLSLLILTSIASVIGGIHILNVTIQIHYTIPVFLGIISLFYIFILIFDSKLNSIAKIAISSVALAMIFNIFGEIYIKAGLYFLMETKYESFEQAYIYALSGLASVIITSVVTTTFTGCIFYPLYESIKPFLKYNDLEL